MSGPSSAQPAPSTPLFQNIAPLELQTPVSLGPRQPQVSYDKHFFVQHANPTCWQYFGSSSLFSITTEVLVHARAKLGPVTHNENYAGPEFWLDHQAEEHCPPPRDTPDRATIERLVALYMSSPNALRSFIDEDIVQHDIESYLACHSKNVHKLVSYQAHQFFRISMMCAIACANKARHKPSYTAEGMQYYAEALRCVEEVTSEVSVESLIALLLLILFSIFYPRKGDIWKLLDFACRLSVELGYHIEDDTTFADEKSRLRRRRIFWGLYSIERSIGQHFGRPSDLPEEIVTTEYPAPLSSVPTADQVTFQSIAMSHYFRLVYLRSEVSRELYLPATTPNPLKFWYQQKLDTLWAWRAELPPYEELTGVGSITCDIAFQSSICFLLQPLLLRALASTRELKYVNDQMETLPAESYRSACQLIDIYKRILRAPEDSQLGLYPLTIVSAMHIQTAAITIMAFCLLAIDGRVPSTNWKVESMEESMSPVQFDNIYDTSGACTVLLTQCAEKWPGMVGMLDIYQSLSHKILPIMMRSGLA